MATEKNVALVLSSGGARGLAHIGAIEQLQRSGYSIRSVVGSSIGALVGGMFATGKMNQFKEWVTNADFRTILSLVDLSLSVNHIVKGEKFIDAMKEIVPDVNIEDLPIPFRAVATDWRNGREVVFDKGSLYDAIRASISIPLFFKPIEKDDMVLVDGGVINPLPLSRAIRNKNDILVAVNVSGEYWGGAVERNHLEGIKRNASRSLARRIVDTILPSINDINFVSLMSRMSSIMIQQNAAMAIRLYKPDILITMPMNRFSSFDYDKIDKIVAIGNSKMRKALSNYSSEGFAALPLSGNPKGKRLVCAENRKKVK